MTDSEKFLDGIEQEIKEILYGYLKAESITGSSAEKDAEQYFIHFFKSQPYWQKHPDCAGVLPISGDPYGRCAAFAMVRGSGSDTIVFVHHNDVVTTEDYRRLRPFAFSPDKLEREFWKTRDSLPEDIRADLETGNYVFGRGACDMKGGASIQMAILKRYGQLAMENPEALTGNLIVMAVPDEENLSAGMRTGVILLAQLKEKYNLNFRLMINTEPQFGNAGETGVFSIGSAGKMMPFFHVRGVLAHAGNPFEGLNSLGIISELVRRTELNPDFSDAAKGQLSPAPTWLCLKDRKLHYDVSLPVTSAGYLSVITFRQTPEAVLRKLRDICRESLDAALKQANERYAAYQAKNGLSAKRLPWNGKVMDFSELFEEASALGGASFQSGYEARIQELKKELEEDRITLADCNFALIDYIYNFIDDLSPRIVYGLIPPYYPNVCNDFMPGLSEDVRALPEELSRFAKDKWGQQYDTEYFYPGISDLSYANISDGGRILRDLENSMPLFHHMYDIPVREIEEISIPCINIGPRGKDVHKIGERILKEDLYERVPRLTLYAIGQILSM